MSFAQGFVIVPPFSVFLRSDRPNYYVAFKNEETGAYLPAVCTKKKKYDDALKLTWRWYREGIPGKDGQPVELKVLSLRDFIRRSDISPSDAEFLVGE